MARPRKEDSTEEVTQEVVIEVAVYDTADGNNIKLVTEREARSPRYKPV